MWFPTLPTDRIRRQRGYPPEVSDLHRQGGRRFARHVFAETSPPSTASAPHVADGRHNASHESGAIAASALSTPRRHDPALSRTIGNGDQAQISATPSAEPADVPPIVTAARDGNTRLLAAVDATAASLGLRPGMPLTQANVRVAGLEIHAADPDGDAKALRQLAAWCLRYAPLAAPDPPDGLWIDVTGATHLWEGEANLLNDLVSRLSGRGLAVRAAIADTPGLAHAMARYAADPVHIIPPGAPPPDLPLAALRLPEETIEGLRLVGFERTAPLEAAARAPLVRRYGTLLMTRLDQLAGRVFEPIQPITPEDAIQARLSFVEPLLTATAFSAVISRLTVLVCGDLEQAGCGARSLDLAFERVDGSVQVLRIGTAQPNRDPAHLGRMLNERLEQVDPGLGVEAMRLLVVRADQVSLTQTQAALTDAPSPSDVTQLVDRLANRLGESRLYRIEPVENYVPERSVRKVVPLPGWRLNNLQLGPSWPEDFPRPVRLLKPPQPIEAMALPPDDPPLAFTWRGIRHRVRHADGPERIAGEWWKRESEMYAVRDYYRVEDEDGRRFWLFRRGDGSDPATGDMGWFLHGFF